MAARNISRSRRSARLVAGVVGAVLAAAICAPAGASAAWTAPIDISPIGEMSAFPEVAVNDSGESALVWEAWTDAAPYCWLVMGRTISPGGVPGPVKTLSHTPRPYLNCSRASMPDVAIDPSGRVAFTWTREVGTRQVAEARTMSSTGDLTRVHTLSRAGWVAFRSKVKIDATGRAVINWVEYNQASGQFADRARRMTRVGSLGPPTEIYVRGHDDFLDPDAVDVAVTPSGQAVFTWRNENYRTVARTMSPTGSLGPVTTISQTGPNTTDDPRVAIDPDGNAVFIWTNHNTTDNTHRIQARRLAADGTLGPVRTVGTITYDYAQARYPQVGVTADGTATLSWLGDEGTADLRILARTLSSDNVLGPVQKVSPPQRRYYQSWWSPSSDFSYLGLDGAGNATLVWPTYDIATPGATSKGTVQARTLTAGGVLGSTTTFVTGDGIQFYRADPEVAVDPAGHAVATWDNDEQIQASVRR